MSLEYTSSNICQIFQCDGGGGGGGGEAIGYVIFLICVMILCCVIQTVSLSLAAPNGCTVTYVSAEHAQGEHSDHATVRSHVRQEWRPLR